MDYSPNCLDVSIFGTRPAFKSASLYVRFLVGFLGVLIYNAPVGAQFAYRTNTKADTYSIIDWTAKGGTAVIDLKLTTGCLLITNQGCIPVVDSDPITQSKLSAMSLRLYKRRGYYVDYIRVNTSVPVIPRFEATIIDASKVQKPKVLSTIVVRFFNDAVRTAQADRLYAAPGTTDPYSGTYLEIYDFPCASPGSGCVPKKLSLGNIGPNQIEIVPHSVALSEDEGTLWIAGVDRATNANGGIIIVDTGGGLSNQGQGKLPEIIGFIAL